MLSIQDKALLHAAFPSLAEDLVPIAAAYGLKPLECPDDLQVHILSALFLVESVLSSLMAPIDHEPNGYTCISIDAEWNVSRRNGVSVVQLAPHSDPNSIYIVPVCIF